jgi:hypothetical protein
MSIKPIKYRVSGVLGIIEKIDQYIMSPLL